jgi:hypothetical protein
MIKQVKITDGKDFGNVILYTIFLAGVIIILFLF